MEDEGGKKLYGPSEDQNWDRFHKKRKLRKHKKKKKKKKLKKTTEDDDRMEATHAINIESEQSEATDSNDIHNENKLSQTKSEEFRNVPMVPWSFDISFNSEEWDKIKPKGNDAGLHRGYTSVLANKFAEQNTYCVLVFKYNRRRRVQSRKQSSPYLRVKAECKFHDCTSYNFTMDEEPTSNTPSMLVKREGEIKHKLDETQKRHSRHLEREIIANDLEQMTTPQWYYQKYATMSTTSKMAGNLNEPKTSDVLRKIKSEQLDQRNLHTDFMQEVKILQEVYQDLEPNGFINFFAYKPFQVHHFLEEQISLFSKLGKSHKGTLLFDATGSILKKALRGEEGQTLLYALVMENPVEGRGAIPIAEFITTDHHASEIGHFLDRVLIRLKSFSRTLQIRRIETDFSWAMLQAVVGATNKHDLSQYIEWCWAVVSKEKSCAEIRKKTYPHICSAHMIKTFSRFFSSIANLD